MNKWVGHRKRRQDDLARRHRMVKEAALAAAACEDWSGAARHGLVLC